VTDNQDHVAIVRVGNPFPDDPYPAAKYQLGDHLESSALVVDDVGKWVNREEFTAYGETAFGSFVHKRYRYTGKERDEESGLFYHGARYYVPWLCKWASCDPIYNRFYADEENLRLDGKHTLNGYIAFHLNPIRYVDPDGNIPKSPGRLGRFLKRLIEFIAGEKGPELPHEKPDVKPPAIERKIGPKPPPPEPPAPLEPPPPSKPGGTTSRTPGTGPRGPGDRGFTNIETIRGMARGVFYSWVLTRTVEILILDPFVLERREQNQDVYPLTREQKVELKRRHREEELATAKKEVTQHLEDVAKQQGISIEDAGRRYEEAIRSQPPYPTISAQRPQKQD